MTDLLAYQIGFLRGRGYTDDEIDRFAALMATEPSVRYAGPPIGCAEDTDTEDHED